MTGLVAADGVLQARLSRELRMKRTPLLTFEYDHAVEHGVRMSKLIDGSPPDQTTTAADLGAVVEAIRGRDRFLVTTHENPDGDALGSLLATHLALGALGKDSVMFLAGRPRSRVSTASWRSATCSASCPPTLPSGRWSPSTARTRAGSAPIPPCSIWRRSRSTSTTTTTTRASAT